MTTCTKKLNFPLKSSLANVSKSAVTSQEIFFQEQKLGSTLFFDQSLQLYKK